MTVVVSKPVGDGVVGTPGDTAKIDALLQQVGMLSPGPATAATRVAAIRRLQEIWNLRTAGKFDGRVDPTGTTLKKLNQTATPLTLKPISLGVIDKGAYLVSFTPEAPPKPYELWFGTASTPGEYIDVTGCKSTDVFTPDNLPTLLEMVRRRILWGRSVQARLFVVLNNKVISQSQPQTLACPVQPHNGVMLPLDETNNGPKLSYQGDVAAESFYGRMFHQIAGVSGFFFKYAGKLETDNAHRGFDCITYAGTTCGAPTNKMAAAADLSEALNTTACKVETTETVPPPKGAPPSVKPTTKQVTTQLDKADPKYVKEFFKSHTTGYYLMYSGGHVVLVVNGVVYEFAGSKNGYGATDVGKWLEPYKTIKLTVRKLPSKPVLAV